MPHANGRCSNLFQGMCIFVHVTHMLNVIQYIVQLRLCRGEKNEPIPKRQFKPERQCLCYYIFQAKYV